MPDIKENMEDKDTILRNKYWKLSMIILVIAFLFFIWIVLEIVSIYYFEMSSTWSLLTMTEWIYVGIFLISFFIVIDLILLAHYQSIKKKKLPEEKTEFLLYKGKRLHIYTHPEGSKGGVFSKTYIKIDENNILNLRVQMIPPRDIWGKKE